MKIDAGKEADQGLYWPLIRMVHLQGGCRALSEPEHLTLYPNSSNGKGCRISPKNPNYYEIFNQLRKVGFSVIGADFYDSPEPGITSPFNWRMHHDLERSPWIVINQADIWSHISYGAADQKNGLLWDVASRISQQMHTCEWRVRQISDCYAQTLNAKVINERFEENQRFYDGFVWYCYLSIQSFLVDACVLRDYFAEYSALMLQQSGKIQKGKKITRMAPLVKNYLKKADFDNSFSSILLAPTEENGWLHKLGQLRDLVVHVAPLASAGRTLYAICKSIPLEGINTLPSIKVPIPSNSQEISLSRSNGDYFLDPEMSYAKFSNALDETELAIDGLDYAHWIIGQLSLISKELVELCPVSPVIPEFMMIDGKLARVHR
jgi:hypothetical protein